jgi:phosphonate transport system substrate-binding protein
VFLHGLRTLRLLLAGLLLFGTGSQASADVYTIAVQPSAPPVTVHKNWTPYIERLSKATGLEFRLKLYDRTAEFERDIWTGVPDFIFSSPIQEVVARESNGYIPLVRSGKMVTLGLFVRSDSPIKSLEQLQGKKVSFVGNKAICSVYLQHLLGNYTEHNKLSYDKEYAGSTRNVIINLLLGKTDAGALFMPELEFEPAETRSQIRAIVVTPEIAPHPLSAHPRVPAAVRDAVTKATLAIADTADGAEILRSMRLSVPVTADYVRDYSSLEAIDVKGLTNWGQ